MATVIELCRRCGFDIPADADGCPECGPDRDPVPSLAALQVAGIALRTRSVRRLPTTPPRADPQPGPVPPAVGARTVFAYTWVLVGVALVAAALAWVARLDRYVTTVPAGTIEWFDDITVTAVLGSVIGLALGLVAMVVWCIRRVGTAITRLQHARLLAALEADFGSAPLEG